MGLFDEFKSYKARLDKMTVQELYALGNDELYLLLNGSVDSKAYKNPAANEAQKVFSVVNYFNKKIIDGSLCDFFVCAEIERYQHVSECLEVIGAYKSKELFENFVNDNEIDLTDDKVFWCDDDDDYLELYDIYPFDEFDEPYCELDEVTDLLMDYARMNIKELTGK